MRLLAVLTLVLALAGCGDGPPTPEQQGAELLAALREVPQSAGSIGPADAPAELTVFAQLTSLQFDEWALEDLPVIVRGPVERGQLRVTVRALPGEREDEDATVAARLAGAASLQGRFWPFLATFVSQYVGVLDESTALEIADAAPGLAASRAVEEQASPRVVAAVRRNRGRAHLLRRGMRTTWVLQRRGTPREVLTRPAAVRAALGLEAER